MRSAVPVDTWTPSFVLPVEEMINRVRMKHQFFKEVMIEGQHYGVIPGLAKDAKPTLLKPGAELLLSSMGLYPEFDDAEPPLREYDSIPGREGIIRYRRDCLVYRQVGALRVLIARAQGTCSSRESKYRWRDAKRACPACNRPTLNRSKPRDGEDPTKMGWYCWKKIDGCGATFAHGTTEIEEQLTGRVPNPDLADLENTIEKIADKRALVATTLLATGCSDIFTQDLEDTLPDQPTTASSPVPWIADSPLDVIQHLKETVSIFQARQIPRNTFEDFIFANLGVRELRGDFTPHQVRNLRNAVLGWSPAPASATPAFDAAAFARAIPNASLRDTYLEQIDPNAISIADLTGPQQAALANLVHRTRPSADPIAA